MDNNLYKTLMEESPVGFAYHRILCDEKGKPCDYEYVEINKAFEQFTGLKGKDVIGKRISETTSYKENFQIDWISLYGKVAVDGVKKEFEYYDSSFDKWFSVSMHSPEKKYFVTFFTDITKGITELNKSKMDMTTLQSRYEVELVESKEALDRFFRVNLDLLCISDMQGRFKKVNEAWESILGYSKDYLEGNEFMGFIHPEDLARTREAMLKLQEREQVFNFVNRYKSLDGDYKYIEWCSQPYGNEIYAAARDITDRKRMEELLFLEKEEYEITLLSIGDGVISVDKNQNIVLLNKIAEKLTGWTRVEAEGRKFAEIFDIVNEATRKKAANPVSEVLKTGEIIELADNTALIRRDGTEISIEDSAAPIRGEDGEIKGVVLVFRDVTEKKKSRAEIEYLSYHDYLTGLYNRRFFEEEVLRLDTERNLPLSIMMLDVNGLKLTNDAFGHEKGDILLKQITEIVKKECRSDDIIARVGGDEFAIILPKTSKVQVDQIKNRISEAVAKETLDSVIISVAIGYETKSQSNQTISDVLKGSENHMYRDKIKTSRAMRNNTLQLIVDTLNVKYENEQTHTERVSQMCNRVGHCLNMSLSEIKELELAGFLHDIGKIIVPADILSKPEKLNEEEYEMIKRHPESGYQILRSVEDYSVQAEYVLCHHERWDGNGYPRKMKGNEIPLTARIIAVADAYEAMTSGRPYRKGIGNEAAIMELERNSGTQFDPEIVDLFVNKVLKQKNESFVM